MKPIARERDGWVGACNYSGCDAYWGQIYTGSNNVFAENKGVAGIGDIVLCCKGHPGLIITGNGTILTNNKYTSRLGDAVGSGVSGVIDLIQLPRSVYSN